MTIILTDVQKLIFIKFHNGKEGVEALTEHEELIIKAQQPDQWPHDLQVKASEALEYHNYIVPPKPDSIEKSNNVPNLATGTYNPIRDVKDQKIFNDEMGMVSAISKELSAYSTAGKMYLSVIRGLNSEFQKRAGEVNEGLLTFEQLDTLSLDYIYQNVAKRKNNMFWIFSGRLKETMTENRVRCMFYAALSDHVNGDAMASEVVTTFLHPSF